MTNLKNCNRREPAIPQSNRCFTLNEEFKEEFEGFLGGWWHQDMGSPEQALEDMINACHPETISDAVKMINHFLSSKSETDEWKIEFIQESTDIYFPNMQLSPLEWLNHVKMRLEEVLRK